MPTPTSVDPLPIALASAASCLGEEEFVVALDSVRNLGLLKLYEIQDALAWSPQSAKQSLLKTDRAESGTETMVRLRLRGVGIKLRTQVWIPGVGRVDLLVGNSLVIEVDSRAHHTSLANYESDRARDRKLVALGFTVIRVSYMQVLADWDAVLADITTLVRRRQHLILPKTSV